MSRPVILALACPCLPVLEVVTSMTLQGLPLSMTVMPFLTSPARMGYVLEALSPACSNSSSAILLFCYFVQKYVKVGNTFFSRQVKRTGMETKTERAVYGQIEKSNDGNPPM